jgi:hypothetical protein
MSDFPGNPRQRPRVAEKVAWASVDMQHKWEMIGHHALLVSKEGPRGVASREEVAVIIGHHFDLLRYEFQVFRSNLDPFIVVFSERSVRDVVFARGRVSDGPIKLLFHS